MGLENSNLDIWRGTVSARLDNFDKKLDDFSHKQDEMLNKFDLVLQQVGEVHELKKEIQDLKTVQLFAMQNKIDDQATEIQRQNRVINKVMYYIAIVSGVLLTVSVAWAFFQQDIHKFFFNN